MLSKTFFYLTMISNQAFQFLFNEQEIQKRFEKNNNFQSILNRSHQIFLWAKILYISLKFYHLDVISLNIIMVTVYLCCIHKFSRSKGIRKAMCFKSQFIWKLGSDMFLRIIAILAVVGRVSVGNDFITFHISCAPTVFWPIIKT